MQFISNDKTVRNDAIQDLNNLNLNLYQHQLKMEKNYFLLCQLLKKLFNY